MKTFIAFIGLLSSLSLWGQELEQQGLEQEKVKLAEQKGKSERKVSDLEKKIAESKKEVETLEAYQKNLKSISQQTANDIRTALRGLPLHMRVASRKASFYRCLETGIQNSQVLDLDRCKKLHSTTFSPEEEMKISQWKKNLSMTALQVIQKQGQLRTEILRNEHALDYAKREVNQFNQQQTELDEKQKAIEGRKSDQELVAKNKKFLNCDASTPTINLEEEVPYKGAAFKGPFHGIPRDNQDGLGTCYANAAKNLLIGTSQGKHNASFLDMALAYKNNGGIVSSALDGGSSCSTLKAIQKEGYCPQKLAPLETGDKNHLIEGLIGRDVDNLSTQAYTIRLLRDFFQDQESLRKENSPLSQHFMKNAKLIIDTLKSNPNIKLPIPVVRHQIPQQWKIEEAYHLNKEKIKVSLEQFEKEYQDDYQKFFPDYMNAVMSGKNLDQIFEIYKEKMDGFFKKHKMENSLAEFKRTFKLNAQKDFEDPKLGDSILESLNFLRLITDKEDLSHDAFIQYCNDSMGGGMEFLSALQPLVDHLNSINVSTENLYDKDGKFKEPRELMQLAVAPSCLNKNNRQKLDHEIECDDGHTFIRHLNSTTKSSREKVLAVRQRVLAGLLQGYPSGNVFDSDTAGHINTIVGMRFDPKSRQCQYLIRESQNGTSGWQDEAILVNKMKALTEVRRK